MIFYWGLKMKYFRKIKRRTVILNTHTGKKAIIERETILENKEEAPKKELKEQLEKIF